ncbi:hypothetical protein P7K49_032301 [Saguinus oedipus]|uniref:Uncharacterized protein n=1 Tax=Saguinus oedipus TaxID=9490 RepID=A0ABQ9TYR6_SAGOE|nr:hypothetical protein P7K49_032301 [Saguinus oedipus]
MLYERENKSSPAQPDPTSDSFLTLSSQDRAAPSPGPGRGRAGDHGTLRPGGSRGAAASRCLRRPRSSRPGAGPGSHPQSRGVGPPLTPSPVPPTPVREIRFAGTPTAQDPPPPTRPAFPFKNKSERNKPASRGRVRGSATPRTAAPARGDLGRPRQPRRPLRNRKTSRRGTQTRVPRVLRAADTPTWTPGGVPRSARRWPPCPPPRPGVTLPVTGAALRVLLSAAPALTAPLRAGLARGWGGGCSGPAAAGCAPGEGAGAGRRRSGRPDAGRAAPGARGWRSDTALVSRWRK